LFEILFYVAHRPFDRVEFLRHDWRIYQFLSDLGLISIQFGFATITPTGALFLTNHGHDS
jgi:hypothetical protein